MDGEELFSISMIKDRKLFYCSWECYEDYARHQNITCRHCKTQVEKTRIKKHLKRCPHKPSKNDIRIQNLEERISILEQSLLKLISQDEQQR